jgi:solute carrier family 7 (L-type amino acid transporter), member 9/15
MIIPGDIGTLIDFFGFTASIFYCAAMVALIVMRFTKKNEHRPIKVRVVLVGVIISGVSLLIAFYKSRYPSLSRLLLWWFQLF